MYVFISFFSLLDVRHIHQSYKLESEITNDDAHVVGVSDT